MENVTNYFRNSVTAGTQGTISYKEQEFFEISLEELISGKICEKSVRILWKGKYGDERENVKSKNAVIALKTLATEFLDNGRTENDIEEMTSVLFMPVCVDLRGILYIPEDGKLPWIPREYLSPMEDPQLAVGETEKYDEYLERTTDQRNQIDSWRKYLQYAVGLYEYVTGVKFEEHYIMSGDEAVKTDGKYYMFEDLTVNASFHILQLYNHLLKENGNKLYRKFTDGITENSRPLIENTDINKMKRHAGQMGGEYPLSPSQREAMNHFGEIGDGEILAVSGPPGTGKTTFLQSVVADMYVKAALKKEKVPIIAAASTNNQAVTNIIDSFGKIVPIGISNLEHKWITGTNSFAVFFPARNKIKETIKKKYQYTTVNGDGFIDELESEENRLTSAARFKREFQEYFKIGTEETDNSVCAEIIWNELKSTDQKRINCLCLAENIKDIIGNETYIGYMGRLNQRIDEEKANEKLMAGQIENIKRDTELFLKRMEEWRNSYEQLPWYVRMFKKFTCFNQKIQAWSFAFIDDAELAFLKRGMSLDEIESIYKRKICDNDEQISLLETKKRLAGEKAEQLEKQKEEIRSKIETLRNEYSAFEKYKAAMPDSAFEQFDLCQFNDLLDRVRYAEFWLAVHYYESRWLTESNPISAKQKGKTFENVLDDMYHRLAMISPCMVMTFFMLPKQFYAYDGNDKKHYYMYNYIDLLIVDEAGQTSPEIAAASFSLAKKAIIVGDEEQIPPVWGTPRALDIAMAVSNGVIESRSDYCKLEENGLNCSQSSVMRVAALSCPYKKYKGSLFLSEHRRCYDEIIEYCNKLVYESKLEPKRGTFVNDEKNRLKGVLPALGFKQVTAENSQRAAGSRQNKAEAEAIAVWLKERYEDILKCYMKEERLDKREVLGIITPFRGQSFLIRRYIKKMIPDYSDFIDVGTVHTFQGAERKVIIFSAVYGNKDGCWFINRSSNLMNVAVSRAKDSFLVFADKDCLVGGEKTAAGLLKKMVFTDGEEI